MKAFTLIILFILTLIAFSDQDTKETIAVIDFEDLTNSNLGPQVAEFLRTALVQTNQFTVVERAQLEKVLKEQKFTMSELVDPTNAAKLGKLLGAKFITTGSITKFGSNWLINARFIDVNTAQTTKAAQACGKSEDEFIVMLSSLVTQLTGVNIKNQNEIGSKNGSTVFEDRFIGIQSEKWHIFSDNNISPTMAEGCILLGSSVDKNNNNSLRIALSKDFTDSNHYIIVTNFKSYIGNKPMVIKFMNNSIWVVTPFRDFLDLEIWQDRQKIKGTSYNKNTYHRLEFERNDTVYRINLDNKNIYEGHVYCSDECIYGIEVGGTGVLELSSVTITSF